MNQITHWLFLFVRWTVLLFSIGALLFSSYMLLALAFNLPTTYKPDKNTTYSIGDISEGMPLKARLWVSVQETPVTTSINMVGQHSDSVNAPADNPLFKKDEMVSVYSDTIQVKYLQNAEFDKTIKALNISEVKLTDGTVYVRPGNMLEKLRFGLPPILKILIAGLIGLQLFRLLRVIGNRSFFDKPNYRIVASIGWIMIGYNVFVFILDRLQETSSQVIVLFESTIAHYRVPFQLTANIQSNVSFQFLILGIIVLAFANAFKKGYDLQKDQHLTI